MPAKHFAMKHTHLLSIVLVLALSACSSQNKSAPDADIQPEVTSVQKSPSQQTRGARSQNVANGSVAAPVNNGPVKAPTPRVPGVRVSSVSVPTKTVALTFDDGPHGTLTPRILNILAKYNAKCTFFVLGSNVQRYPGIVSRMVSEGHEVANHSWNHPNLATSSRASVASQLSRTNDAIVNACGRKPRLMRPPYGACNASLCSWMKSEYGLTTVLWSVDTNDWRKPGVSAVISRAVNGAKPGSIILVHDIHSSTADAVEGIVKGLQARGYELVTVSELMNRGYRYARQQKAGQTPEVPADPSAPAETPVDAPASPALEPAAPVTPVIADDQADSPAAA